MSIMLMSRIFRMNIGGCNRKLLAVRLADFAEHTKLRLEDAISAKLAFNRTRGYRHGGRKF